MMVVSHFTAARRGGRVAVLALAVAASLLVGCGDKKDKAASQTAARVNKSELTVHQINFVLQQQRGLKPEQADAAGKQVLERLIDQELAVQRADDQKLDRDPRVVQQLEAARREILARAYLEKVSESAAKPSPEEIKKYYEDKPALFKERRIYQIQEIAIEAAADQVSSLRAKLTEAKTVAEFLEYLKGNDFKFNVNQAVRAAEQLPLQSLDAFAKLKDGQSLFNQGPNGAQVIVLAGSRSQPVSEEQARPAIEQYLLNERKRKLVEEDLKTMRAAAKIEYIGKFAEGRPGAAAAAASAVAPTTSGATAPATPSAAAPAAASDAAAPAPASPPASGLSASDIATGMGLKK